MLPLFADNCSLVCTALYNDGDGERKYLPQFFKFIVANPLSVRTKVSFLCLPIFENVYFRSCIETCLCKVIDPITFISKWDLDVLWLG